MNQHAVAQAIATLQAQGKALSHGNIRRLLGYGSLRDIVRFRNELLPALDAVPAESVPPAPILVERPLCLCYRCGYGRWHERTIGDWVCALCGGPPPP
jgi:hypothetical protein